MPNASIPTPEPVKQRKMFGAYGRSVGTHSVAFVSGVNIKFYAYWNTVEWNKNVFNICVVIVSLIEWSKWKSWLYSGHDENHEYRVDMMNIMIIEWKWFRVDMMNPSMIHHIIQWIWNHDHRVVILKIMIIEWLWWKSWLYSGHDKNHDYRVDMMKIMIKEWVWWKS